MVGQHQYDCVLISAAPSTVGDTWLLTINADIRRTPFMWQHIAGYNKMLMIAVPLAAAPPASSRAPTPLLRPLAHIANGTPKMRGSALALCRTRGRGGRRSPLCTLRRSTFSIPCSALELHASAFGSQSSAFFVRRSSCTNLGLRHSAFRILFSALKLRKTLPAPASLYSEFDLYRQCL